MNVLMISTDHTLAMDKEKAVGDSQDRHILYGKYLTNLFIVSLSGKTRGLNVKKLSDNVTVYPICYTDPFTYLWKAYSTARRLCRENKIDVITTQDPLITGLIGYAMKRKFHIPLNVQLVGNYIDNDLWLRESKLNRILNMIGRFVLKRADCVRVVSNIIENNMVKNLRIPPEKIVVLPTFTNVDRFTDGLLKASVREKYVEFEGIVLFVGRLSKEKSLETLLSAAIEVIKKHPRALFLIVGDGADKIKLERLAMKLGIDASVRFDGGISHKDLPAYYKSCDIVVLPSKHEGWGKVVIEALACGKPVIVSDGCGTKGVVEHVKCGFVFPVGRPDILARQIICLLDDQELRIKMGTKGKEYASEAFGDKDTYGYRRRELYERTIRLAQESKRN